MDTPVKINSTGYKNMKTVSYAGILLSLFFAMLMTLANPTLTFARDDDYSLQVGIAALDDGFYELAQKQFEGLLLSGSTTTLPQKEKEEIVVFLLRSLYSQNKLEEMLEVLKSNKILKASSARDYWYALVQYDLGKWDKALNTLNDFQETQSENIYAARALRLKAWVFLKTGDIHKSVEAFEKYDELYPESDDYSQNLLDWGKVLMSHTNQSSAEVVFRRLAVSTNNAVIAKIGSYWLGWTLRQRGDVIRAERNFLDVMKSEVASGELRAKASLEYAGMCVAQTNYEDAVSSLASGLSLAGSDKLKEEMRIELGKALMVSGRLDEAVPLLKSFIAEATDDDRAGQLQLIISDAMFSAERYAQAVEEYQDYLETFPDVHGQARAYSGKGWGLIRLKRYSEAVTAFEKAYDLFENERDKEECLLKIGDSHFANKQYGLANEGYQLLLDTYPHSKYIPQVMFQMGMGFAALEDNLTAETKFNELVTAFPENRMAEKGLLRIAEINIKLERWEEVAEGYSRFMDAYTNSVFYPQALYGRGIARYNMDASSALSDFETILNDYPDSEIIEKAFYMRAIVLYKNGSRAEGIDVAKKFIENNSNSKFAPQMRFWMGECLYNAESYADAQEQFEKYVAGYPKNLLAPEALLRAGKCAVKRREYLTANDLFTQLAKDYSKSKVIPRARFEQADALSQLGKFGAAVLIYDEIINNYPKSDVVHLAWGRKGDCQFTLGSEDRKRYDESITSYRVVTKSVDATLDEILQADYKIARSLEKIERNDEALEHYYAKVMIPFLVARGEGKPLNESAKLWFTRASMNAAEIVENNEDWRRLVNILDRVAGADVAVSQEAAERINNIKEKHWWLFY